MPSGEAETTRNLIACLARVEVVAKERKKHEVSASYGGKILLILFKCFAEQIQMGVDSELNF